MTLREQLISSVVDKLWLTLLGGLAILVVQDHIEGQRDKSAFSREFGRIYTSEITEKSQSISKILADHLTELDSLSETQPVNEDEKKSALDKINKTRRLLRSDITYVASIAHSLASNEAALKEPNRKKAKGIAKKMEQSRDELYQSIKQSGMKIGDERIGSKFIQEQQKAISGNLSIFLLASRDLLGVAAAYEWKVGQEKRNWLISFLMNPVVWLSVVVLIGVFSVKILTNKS